MAYLSTDELAARYRTKAVNLETASLLITSLQGSEQETDLSVPANCDGLGRIHHFRREVYADWPTNPLPIDPAAAMLGLENPDVLRAQVFQNAVCNWRCWYCFVDFKLLAGDPKYSRWVSPRALLEMFLQEEDRAPIIDLSGGQPDLVPEWVPWTMQAMRELDMEGKYYLWSDDNLSGDYFWRYLNNADRELIANFQGYGRVGCFKGYNPSSFSFNTQAEPALFDRQFDVFERLLRTGIDLYAYATFTAIDISNVADDMKRFVDRLQSIDLNLPLRTVPLKVLPFSPVNARNTPGRDVALSNQAIAINLWQEELAERFTIQELQRSIHQVPWSNRGI